MELEKVEGRELISAQVTLSRRWPAFPEKDGRQRLDGRSSFYFATTGGGVVVFSGLNHRNIKVGPHDTIVQPIDALVVIISKDIKSTRIDAVGECRFRQYQAGRALPVACSAHTDGGLYEAMFESDGRAPEVY